jgi:hypothetical protein
VSQLTWHGHEAPLSSAGSGRAHGSRKCAEGGSGGGARRLSAIRVGKNLNELVYFLNQPLQTEIGSGSQLSLRTPEAARSSDYRWSIGVAVVDAINRRRNRGNHMGSWRAGMIYAKFTPERAVSEE